MIVPGDGRKFLRRVLGVDAALDRVPAPLDRVLRERERLARRDADLLGDEVEAGDLLGDAVLDLQARVHLEEVELAVLVQHLDGAGVHVAARDRDLHRGFAHRAPGRVGDRRRRRLLDQLLVPALRRAVAVAEVHGVAVRVAEDLELDVPRPGQVALDVALGPAEVRLRLALAPTRTRPRRSSASATTFMPRPPPPNAALIAIG